MARRLRWVVLTVIGVVFLLWLVLLAPKLLVSARSDASLQDVTDPAKRHELEDARLELQNDVRTTLLQALGRQLVIPRKDIKHLESSGISLMPEGLEAGLTPADLRDLIAFMQEKR